MGLFDTVVIEGLKLKLPKEINSYLKKSNAEFPTDFQTKDLINSLATYKINEKGQIYEGIRESTGKKIPFPGGRFDWVQERPFLERLWFKYKDREFQKKYPSSNMIDEYKTVFRKSSMTNTFEIYNYTQIAGRYIDISYTVTTTKGKVTNIKLNNYSIESEKSAAKRLKEDEEFQKNISIKFANQKAFRNKWYYPVLRETYTPAVFFAKKIVQNICNYIIKNSMHWHGV